jgi:hypothetical protein
MIKRNKQRKSQFLQLVSILVFSKERKLRKKERKKEKRIAVATYKD